MCQFWGRFSNCGGKYGSSHAFEDLSKIQVFDKIYVLNSKGGASIYAVVSKFELARLALARTLARVVVYKRAVRVLAQAEA